MQPFMLPVTSKISIEELVERIPGAVRFLRKKGITCIACGEPIWGTLQETAHKKGYSDEEIEALVEELNQLPLD
jgi:iron-sulfur cluster repair protein YtfE (RIC family)